MSLRDRIQTDVTAAMRSGDSLRRDVLRMAQNAVYAVEKRERREPTDDDVAAILTREVKTRRESIEAFRKGAREDLAAKEEAEIAILTDYLPEQLDDAAIQALVAEAVAATGAANVRDLGKVMGWLSPKTRGRADGKRVSELVAQALARADLAGHDSEPGGHDHAPAGHDSEPAGHDHAPAGHDHAPAGHDHAPAGHDHAPAGHDHAPAGHDHAPAGHDAGRPHGAG